MAMHETMLFLKQKHSTHAEEQTSDHEQTESEESRRTERGKSTVERKSEEEGNRSDYSKVSKFVKTPVQTSRSNSGERDLTRAQPAIRSSVN